MGAPRIGMRRGQQGIDHVDPGFHRNHYSRLEHAGEAQVGMTLGPLSFMALLVAHHAADIVHLQAQQMADAMRKKYAGYA